MVVRFLLLLVSSLLPRSFWDGCPTTLPRITSEPRRLASRLRLAAAQYSLQHLRTLLQMRQGMWMLMALLQMPRDFMLMLSRYITGHAINTGMLVFCLAVTSTTMLY